MGRRGGTSVMPATSTSRGQRGGRFLMASCLALAVGAGCDQGRRLDPPVISIGNEIIGGFAANDPALDAIGSLVVELPGASFELCGATLIAPESVLSAKHCASVIPLIVQIGGRLVFAVGPDSAHPRQTVDVVAVDLAPGDTGGFVGFGHDVSVMHLDHPITDLAPVQIGQLDDGQVGEPFAAIGYGVVD